MEHQIKVLAEAMTNNQAKHLIQTHVHSLHFENGHLIIYVHNAAPLHELENSEMDVHLQKGIAKVYGEEMTYEFRLNKPEKSNEESEIGQQHSFNLIHDSKMGRK